MDVDMTQPSPLQNGDNLSPWPTSAKTKAFLNHLQPSPIPHHLLNQSLTISGGRTSTPIYSHFTLNMNTELMADPSQDITSVAPTSTAHKTNESSWWRRRRLPSPISEAGDIPEMEPANNIDRETRHQKEWPDSPSSMDVDGDTLSNMFLQVPEQSLGFPIHTPAKVKAETETMIPIPTTSSTTEPAKRPSVTAPRREKMSFSMGYRADCEKCQMRVPGHYSHIVRS